MANKPTGGHPNATHDNPEQSKRFIETAKEIGTDESAEAFERVFGKVVGAKPGVGRPHQGGKPTSS